MFKEYLWLIIILIIGVLIVCLLGWAWVYLWDWGNKNVLLGFTAPVNDSIWELTKIFVYPFLLFFVVLYVSAYHALRNPAIALLCATAAAILFFWFWFYVYTWFNPERSNFGANVTLWILAVIIAMVILFFVFTAPYLGDGANYACIAIYLIVVILWCIFTYTPPCNCGMWWHKECGEGYGGGGGTGGLIPPPCGRAAEQATDFGDDLGVRGGGGSGGGGGDGGGGGGGDGGGGDNSHNSDCDGYHSDGYKKRHYKKGKHYHQGYESDSSSSSSSSSSSRY